MPRFAHFHLPTAGGDASKEPPEKDEILVITARPDCGKRAKGRKLGPITPMLAESRSVGSHRAVTAHRPHLLARCQPRGAHALRCLLLGFAVCSACQSGARAEKARHAIAM